MVPVLRGSRVTDPGRVWWGIRAGWSVCIFGNVYILVYPGRVCWWTFVFVGRFGVRGCRVHSTRGNRRNLSVVFLRIFDRGNQFLLQFWFPGSILKH